ncbi:MAG: hypothetical protein AMXMBFR37_06820 [Steroidobacteraceae bacterium]
MTDQAWLRIQRGRVPLVLSIPHSGVEIPDDCASGLRSAWLARLDTDWYLPQVYAFAKDLNATIIWTEMSRTVVDPNRDPAGISLYPGMATTALCPIQTFDGEPLYQSGCEPGPDEIERRRLTFHSPYHRAIGEELARLRQQHPHVVIYDAHSIRSRVPRLFEGELPNLNIGTNSGRSCDIELSRQLAANAEKSSFTHVVDGRFKGGYITRHWGRPDDGIHAVQMEIACRSYLDENGSPPTPENWPPGYSPRRAETLQTLLRKMLETCIGFARAQAAPSD